MLERLASAPISWGAGEVPGWGRIPALFVARGRGGAALRAVLDALADDRYDSWLVLEQDTAITADEPAVDGGPLRDATQSIAFINSAQTEEIHR
jgi:sugar phosphate isomerase/epimerase